MHFYFTTFLTTQYIATVGLKKNDATRYTQKLAYIGFCRLPLMMRLAAWRCTRRKSTRCFSAVLEDVVIGSVARTPIGAFCGGHESTWHWSLWYGAIHFSHDLES